MEDESARGDLEDRPILFEAEVQREGLGEDERPTAVESDRGIGEAVRDLARVARRRASFSGA
jgi:hypothetical protein